MIHVLQFLLNDVEYITSAESIILDDILQSITVFLETIS